MSAVPALRTALLVLTIAAPLDAKTLAVPQQHSTIQGAVDVAAPGDRIEVAAGIYEETVFIPASKTGLRLIGKKGAVIDALSSGDSPKYGIRCEADAARIERLTIMHAGAGNTSSDTHGVLALGLDTVLSRITVVSGGAFGIEVRGAGSRVDRCDVADCKTGINAAAVDCAVARCTSLGNDKGIEVNSGRASIVDCKVWNATDVAIGVVSDDSRIERCSIEAAQVGIRARGTPCVVKSNRVRSCASIGIDVLGAATSAIDNEVSGCLELGIYANSAEEIRDNRVSSCVLAGIYVFGGNTAVRDNDVRRCGSWDQSTAQIRVASFLGDVVNNRVEDGSGDGIRIENGTGCRVAGNHVSGHVRDGIQVDEISASIEVSNNVATKNHGEGIQNGGSSTFMVGNTMTKNRIDLANTGTFSTFSDNVFKTGGPTAMPQVE